MFGGTGEDEMWRGVGWCFDEGVGKEFGAVIGTPFGAGFGAGFGTGTGRSATTSAHSGLP